MYYFYMENFPNYYMSYFDVTGSRRQNFKYAAENGGFSIPLFDGEEEYDNTEWQVCFMQGEPKWEVNVKTQYDKTDSTIKTLKSKK